MWINAALIIVSLLLTSCYCQQRRFDENVNTHQFTPAKRYLQQQVHQQDILKKALQTQIQKPATPVDVQDIFKSYKSLNVAKDAEQQQQQASDTVSTEHQPQEQKTHNWLRNVIQSQLHGSSPSVTSIQDILKMYDNGAQVAQQQHHQQEVSDPRYGPQQPHYYQDSLRSALRHQLASYSSPLVGSYRQGKATEAAEPQEHHPLLPNQQPLPLLHMLQMLASLQMLQGLGTGGGGPYVDPIMMLLFGSALGPPGAPPLPPPYPLHNQ